MAKSRWIVIKRKPPRECVAADDIQINRIRDKCDETNAEGKAICMVQVSNSLLLQCIKCIRRVVHCIAAYSFPSHLWRGGWPPPPPPAWALCNIFSHPSLPNLVWFRFQPWKLTIEVPSTSLEVNSKSIFNAQPNLFLDSSPNWTLELKIYIEHPPGN